MQHPESSLICLIVPPLGPTNNPTYREQHHIRASLSSDNREGTKAVTLLTIV